MELEYDDDEMLWTEFQFNSEKYILCVIYRPQWHKTSSGIWNKFRHSLERALDITNNVILTGDINIDMLANNKNELFDILREYNSKNIIATPTRITLSSQNRLDPFIVSDC